MTKANHGKGWQLKLFFLTECDIHYLEVHQTASQLIQDETRDCLPASIKT